MENNEQKIEELLNRGVEDLIVKEDLEKKMKAGKGLRIKYGIDPTGPKIHIGRASTMRKLKKFQDLGHKIVLIIGDFTGQVGDASDKESERPMLSQDQIKENMRDYLDQISRIFDVSKVEVHYNSEWLGKLDFNDICRLADSFSVAEMIDRENFSKRFKEGKRISLREFMYPLMQGYDSVAIKADIEIGGTDQLFNVLAGRTLQKAAGQEPQNIMTFKLLEGTDGRKMSTSWGNVILISDEPNDMFGKIMSIKDELIEKYFEICTDVPMEEVGELLSDPRGAKIRLASEIVEIYHGSQEAQKSREHFENVFSKKGVPEDIEEIEMRIGEKLIDILDRNELAKSRSEARQKINQSGVKIDEKPVTNVDYKIKKDIDGAVLKVGKREFRKIQVVE
ncbi:MAG: tyrosine--tRNA ligase [Patescibacteria group bacterium]|jgi:tyrosyl-tRNA synthetase|nr:tyrosine--tRNA ligase [Patescibacteria group bacterium]